MGNTKQRTDGVITFDDLRKDIEKSSADPKAKGKPFRFQLDTDTLIEIPPPTLDDTREATKAMDAGDEEGFFRIILGDHFETVMKEFGGRDAREFIFFQKRLVEFYDLGEALA